MKRVILAVAMGLVVSGWAGAARAADNDPTGTWKWTVTRNDQAREVTLKLKLEGETLSGAMLGRNNQETKIADAKFKDGEVSFTVTREFNGNKVTTKYKGKVEGDTIKGKQESDRNGQTQSRDWEAKRAKEEAKPAA